MVETYNPVMLKNFLYKGKKTLDIREMPTRYFRISVNCFPIIIPLDELSDSEILSFSEKMGIFSFLDNPDEDIYSLSDGKPLE